MGFWSNYKKRIKLEGILTDIGEGFTYMTDQARFGRKEFWAANAKRYLGRRLIGDCDDFALECHERCTEEGFRARLVECRRYDENNNLVGHLICEVEGWILHNGGKDRDGNWWVETRKEFEAKGWWFIKMSDFELKENGTWYSVEQ